MATQTGTLKAGNQLVIDSQGASVDYDVSVTGYAVDFKRIQQKNTLSLGPHKVDCSYSVTVNSGSPSVYKVQPNGQREYTAETLPDPATLGAGDAVVVDGFLVKKTPTGMLVDGVASKRSIVSVVRLYGWVGKDTSTGRTAQLIMRAPAHYDAVRINVLSAASEGNAWKVTVAPSASRNNRGPLDAAGSAITPTVVTFGSTDRRNPRNPGGGAVTVTSTGASGTTAANNLIQDRICSDIINIRSLDRVDVPTNPPLIYVRIYGQNIPIMATEEMKSSNANSWASTCVPEFLGGYITGDYSVTNPSSDFAEFGWPAVEVEFFLRGKRVRNIGVTGDSTDQGYVAATASPQFGGNINGYMRRFVDKLRADGEPVGFSAFAVAGQRSFMTHNNALPSVMSGELTHLVIRPFSINDIADGTTVAIANAALQRTTMLIQACVEYGVVPILLRPFNNGINMATSLQYPLVMAYCDAFKASGGLVLDFTGAVNLPGSQQYLKPEYLSYTSGGVLVDDTHPADAGHQAIADWIYSKASWVFS